VSAQFFKGFPTYLPVDMPCSRSLHCSRSASEPIEEALAASHQVIVANVKVTREAQQSYASLLPLLMLGSNGTSTRRPAAMAVFATTSQKLVLIQRFVAL